MTPEDLALLRALRDDFPLYSSKCLKIRTKTDRGAGKIVPFELNKAQLFLHERLERQRAEAGKVRALIVKGRQQGCSTYIGGRFYQKTTFNHGLKTFILTHRDDATANLFMMVKRFHDNSPLPVSTGYSNRKELIFDKLDSGYALGTAGSGTVGRSDTIDLFHGSEAAYWQNADEIESGILQAAEMAQEIVFESTGNGFDPFFYPKWELAVKGKGDYIPIFIPWFWQDEYTRPVPKGFVLDAEEAELASKHGVSLPHLAWRRNKIENGMSLRLFRQEYPCTADEAFQTSGEDTIIPLEWALAAIGRHISYHNAKSVMGVDVGMSETGDPSAIVARKGGKVNHIEEFRSNDTLVIAGRVKERFHQLLPEAIYVDANGWGAGVAHTLSGWGLPVTGVMVQERASSKDRYHRLRDELWWKAREFFESRMVAIDENLELARKLATELCSVQEKTTVEGKQRAESKDELAKRSISSPNLADAFNMTMMHGDQYMLTPDIQQNWYGSDETSPSRFA